MRNVLYRCLLQHRNGLRLMLLNLKDIFVSENTEYPFRYRLDISGFELSKGEFPFREPIRVSGVVANKAGVVALNVVAGFTFFTNCDRCFKEITEQSEFTFENILVKESAGDDSGELLVVENEQLDLDEYVASNIVLNLPMKHLCREDCKGLCPVCGKNLNEGDCGCEKRQADPRLTSLGKILEQRKDW